MDNKERVFQFPQIVPQYSDKVLIGHWAEERENYTKHNYCHNSTYRADYVRKPVHQMDVKALWDSRERNNGIDPNTLMNCKSCYMENFSSAYDLRYNHFPKWFGSPEKKCIEDRQEMLTSFGNLTKRGFVDYKRGEWSQDAVDPRRTIDSIYKEVYIEHSPEAYFCTRYKEDSYRNEKCNPLTWECKKLKQECLITPEIIASLNEPDCVPPPPEQTVPQKCIPIPIPKCELI